MDDIIRPERVKARAYSDYRLTDGKGEKSDDLRVRLQNLEKELRTVRIVFPARGEHRILVAPSRLHANPGDTVHWTIVASGVDLEHVVIKFAAGESYFPDQEHPHRRFIRFSAEKEVDGHVEDDHAPGVDKYSIEWKLRDQEPDSIDPEIIVTDP